MATKKKTRAKIKKKKKTATRKISRKKKTVRKPARRKTAAKKKPAPKSKKKAAKKLSLPKPAAAQATLEVPPGERIGTVTHYYSHLSVAIVGLESGILRVGEWIHIKGHTSDFAQRVESMEVDHIHVNEVYSGQSFGVRVREHAREHDVVYKVTRS